MDVGSLHERGFAVAPGFVAADVVRALREHALARDAQRAFRPARVGRGDARIERGDVRGDRILWLEEDAPEDVERPLVAELGRLRERVNAALWLGLWDFEAHYAIYPPGAFYARHRDRFADERCDAPSRVLSFAVYLNDDWRLGDGGALRLHVDARTHVDVAPRGGTLACFLADRFEHEVLPATRARLAVTGWFRRRGQ